MLTDLNLGLIVVSVGISRANRMSATALFVSREDTYRFRYQFSPQPRKGTIHAYDR